MIENGAKQTKNGPGLYEIAASAYRIIYQRCGVSQSDMTGPTRRNDLHKARILFASILAAFEVPAGTIARLLHKTTESIEGYIAEYNHQLATNAEFQQITNEVKNSLTINI